MKRFFLVLTLLLTVTVLSVSAAPMAGYREDGSLPAVTEAQDGILPLIFCRGTNDLTAKDVTWEEGRHGQVVMLDGTDAYFRMDGTLLRKEALTVAMWVNWLDAETSPTGQRLLSMRGADRATRYIALSPNGGESGQGLCLEMQMGADKVVLTAEEATPLQAGWQHIAVVWEATTLRLYLNGALLAEDTAPATPDAFDTRQLFVGKGMRAGEAGYIHAAVDDIYFYNRALKAAEVARLAGIITETTTTVTEPTTTTTVTPATQADEPVTPDPLQPQNRLWLIFIPAAAALLLVATAHPWKRK